MKKLMILWVLTSISLALADFPEAQITNLNGSYNDPSGHGVIEHIKYDGASYSNAEFSVEKQASVLTLKLEDKEISLEDMPEQINDLKSFSIQDLNLESLKDEFTVKFEQLKGEDHKGESSLIKDFYIHCEGRVDGEDEADELMNTCVNKNMKVMIGEVKTGKDTVKGIYVTTNEQNLYLSVVADGKRIKAYGQVWYEGDLLKLKITKVKYKFLNITKQFFNELKKKESDTVKVQRPWIEVQLK